MSRHAPRKKNKQRQSPQNNATNKSVETPRQTFIVSPSPENSENCEERENATPPRRKPVKWMKVLQGLGIIAGIGYAAVTYFEWREIRDNFMTDQRAWIGVKGFTLYGPPTPGQQLIMNITAINTGKTPALDVTFANCGTGDDEQTTLTWNCPKASSVIAPGAENVFVNTSDPVSQAYVDRLTAGIQRTYYRFTIQYRDIFGIARTTGVCAFYPLSKTTPFGQCLHGNWMK